MGIEVHNVAEPEWIRTLVNDVLLAAFEPLGFIGQLGYRWWEPDNVYNTFAGWQIAVFPTPNEICGSHECDGRLSVNGFSLNIGSILNVFSSIKSVVWNAPTEYNGDLDGPELHVQGLFAGKHVWLRVFNIPPSDEPPSYCIDPAQGTVWKKA